MAQLKYKSMIKSSKPIWLMKLQMWVSNTFYGCNYAGDAQDYRSLNEFIRNALYSESLKDLIQSVVTTEIRTDEGKTVLFVKRNERVILTYYFE